MLFVGVVCCVGSFQWFVDVVMGMIDNFQLIDWVFFCGFIKFYVCVFVLVSMEVSVCFVNRSLKVFLVVGWVLVNSVLYMVCVFWDS